MCDGDDLGRVTNEILLTLFVPASVLFVGLWAVFRLRFDAELRTAGLAPIVVADGPGAIAAGYCCRLS